MAERLPTDGGDNNLWGAILNGFLGIGHNADGTTKERLDQIAAPTAAVALNNQRITGLGTATAATDAVTKGYADAIAQGLDPKASVRAATTANITLSGAQTIDGVAVIALDRVLVKNQTTGSQNGIYVAAAGAWARSTDADVSAEVNAGMYTFIEEGTAQADQGWVLATNNPITLGTTALSFTQFSGGGAGGGIPATIVDVKGDIIAATAADTVARLAVGTNGQVLTAASGQTTGLQWATPTGGTTMDGFVNIRTYGALGNDAANDTAAVLSAVAASSAAGGGILYCPPGVYRIHSLITIPAKVNVMGAGTSQNAYDAATVFRCMATDAGFLFNADGGHHRDFHISGATSDNTATRIATRPLRRIGSVSGTRFDNIDSNWALEFGLDYQSAQNDLWTNCRIRNAGNCGATFDDGAGGLTFLSCDISNPEATVANVQFRETISTGGYSYPTDIKFLSCRFEYIGTNAPSVYHQYGERIWFKDCLFGQRYEFYTGAIVHQGDGSIGALVIEGGQFTGATFSGNSAVHGGVSPSTPLVIRGHNHANAVSYMLDFGATANVICLDQDTWSFGGGTALFSPSTVGSKGWFGYPLVKGASAFSGADSSYVDGDAFGRYLRYANGSMEWGPGNVARDTSLSRSAANTLTASGGFITGGGLVAGTDLVVGGNLDHNGTAVGFYGTTPAARPAAYTVTNVTTDRTFNANATTIDELADVVGTLIADLKTLGLLQ